MLFKRVVIYLLLLFLLNLDTVLSAEEQTSFNEVILPPVAAVVPGAVLHGAGHFVAGERETAGELLLIEGVGLLMLAGSGYILADGGAPRDYTGPLVPFAAFGVSFLVLPFIADFYGVTIGRYRSEGDWFTDKDRTVTLNAGLEYTNDPAFDYSLLVKTEIDYHYKRFVISPMINSAIDDDTRHYQLSAKYRFAGQKGHLLENYAAFFKSDAIVRAGYYDFNSDGFYKYSTDISLRTVINSGSLWKTTRGIYFVYEAGFNREWVYFDFDETLPAITSNQILFETGVGFMTGNLSDPAADIYLFYNHRRDTFYGGLPSGFLGHVGASVTLYPWQNTGISLKAVLGTSSFYSLSGKLSF
ncbi:MAG: hypothetical protein JXK07_07700 [Spirochaetes bacterium]|nr:hypothetical protein [Spirochaetota bacterium]MBN2769737.1 hypothetical protein [Spirochaetota bacterium]